MPSVNSGQVIVPCRAPFMCQCVSNHMGGSQCYWIVDGLEASFAQAGLVRAVPTVPSRWHEICSTVAPHACPRLDHRSLHFGRRRSRRMRRQLFERINEQERERWLRW